MNKKSATVSGGRLHYLDSLRAFAMLLGIVLHAAISFMPTSSWPVHDIQQSEVLGGFISLVHGFRMQLFFLVSGFFTAMVWRRRGRKILAQQRLHRILIPLLLGTLTINPIIHRLCDWTSHPSRVVPFTPISVFDQWAMGIVAPLKERFPLDFPQGIRASYHTALTSENLHPILLRPIFDHLWFLWFLCCLLPFFFVWTYLVRWEGVPRGARRVLASRYRLLWLSGLTLLPQLFMQGQIFGPEPCTGLFPFPHLLFYYGIFFFVGSFLYENRDLNLSFGKAWCGLLLGALFVAFPLGMLTRTVPTVSGVAQVVYAWLMIEGMMGLFRRFVTQVNSQIRYIADASYWFYLAHIPVVILLQHAVRFWPFPAEIKCLLIVAVTVGILLLSYEGCVRYTWLGNLLNGPRERPKNQLASR